MMMCIALRFIPTMHFGDKMVYFREQHSGTEVKQNVKSTYLSVPVNVKYAAQRFNNYRPYVLAGIGVGIASKLAITKE